MNSLTDSEGKQCPQCRSERVTDTGPLRVNVCEYCGNEWADISPERIQTVVSEGDQFELVGELQQPVTVREITGRTLTLEGKQGGEYKLTIASDASATLKRKKGGGERNQFGSRWTNARPVEYRYVNKRVDEGDA